MVETLTRKDLGFRVVELSDYRNPNGITWTNVHPPVAPEESKLESIAKEDDTLKAVRAVPVYLDRSAIINDAKKEETCPYAGYIRILKPEAQKDNDIYFKLFDMTGQPGRYAVVFYEGPKNKKQSVFSRQEQKVQFNKLYALPSDVSFINLKFPEYNSIPTKPAHQPEYAGRK